MARIPACMGRNYQIAPRLINNFFSIFAIRKPAQVGAPVSRSLPLGPHVAVIAGQTAPSQQFKMRIAARHSPALTVIVFLLHSDNYNVPHSRTGYYVADLSINFFTITSA